MNRLGATALLAALALAGPAARAGASEWRPANLHATSATLLEVLAVRARAAGAAAPRERRERWTYATGERRIAVDVAVRGDDFRSTIRLGSATYEAGRLHGVRWRADANGIVHATWSDDQGDPLDRLPQSLFPFSAADCELSGETSGPAPAWVVVDRAPHDKPHWFFVDEASGAIVREITREGKYDVETTFDRFTADPLENGARRPRAWQVRDGERADDLDVSVDAVQPGPVAEADVALPQDRRLFEPAARTPRAVTLPARFDGDRIVVAVEMEGMQRQFVLDTGTQDIEVASSVLGRRVTTTLQHATLPLLRVGPLALADASVLAIPTDFGVDGILGGDFFYGHVIHVDYAGKKVEVLSADEAAGVFHDPQIAVLRMNVGEGIPLVQVRIGDATGDRFALDTGSAMPNVLAPFVDRHRTEIERSWKPAAFPRRGPYRTDDYLEGSIALTARRVDELDLGPVKFRDLIVGTESANPRSDAISIALDGIIGTQELRFFDLWFDYDDGLLAMRPVRR